MKLLLLPAALLAATGIAAADTTTEKVYRELDLDHDGRVTAVEFINQIIAISFQKIDTNHDSKIEKAEWTVTEKGDAGAKAFAALDANHDGVVDKDEYSKNPVKRETLRKIFLTIDPNDDGILVVEELPANSKPN